MGNLKNGGSLNGKPLKKGIIKTGNLKNGEPQNYNRSICPLPDHILARYFFPVKRRKAIER